MPLATDAYPALDPGIYLAWLDAAAEAIADAAELSMPLPERLAMLDRQLFEVEGFSGNKDDYFDPRNSYLNDVNRPQDRHTDHGLGGLPGGRLAARTASRRPCRSPRIFSLHRPLGTRVFIDPFNRGARIPAAELVARLAPMAGGTEQARQILPRVTTPASRREVAMRMLRNLRQIYARRKDNDRLLVVANRMVALDPKDPVAVRERGHVLAEMECYQAAYHDYQHYLRLAPLAADGADIQARIERLRPIATRLN